MERSAAIGAGPFSFRGWIGLLRMDLKGKDWPTRPESWGTLAHHEGGRKEKGGKKKREEKREKKGKRRGKKKEGILYGLILHE